MQEQLEQQRTIKKTEHTRARIVFNVIAFAVLTIVVILSLIPFVMIISGSFSENTEIIKRGYSVLPRGFSLDGYKIVFAFPKEIGRAYMVSISRTVLGTLLGLIITMMAGYALQCRQLRFRNGIAFYFYFTMLFSGGLVPWYMVISNLGMKDTMWSLTIPLCGNAFYILLTRNFMRDIPEALVESAKIDGAGDFLVFRKIIIPLSKPVIATVGLFLALAYWNDWYQASLFVRDQTMWPLQYKLYKILSAQSSVSQAGAENLPVTTIPTETMKLANAVIATGPIILLYPFLQRYFVQGITIGAVKG